MKREEILNSINLNVGTEFPYLTTEVVGQKSFPRTPGFRVLHWHEDFQFILVKDGSAELRTLDDTAVIHAGEGLFINKNVIHFIDQGENCHYHDYLFPDYFLKFYFGSPAGTLVDDISSNERLPFYIFHPDCSWEKEVMNQLDQLWSIPKEENKFYSYEILTGLTSMWLTLRKNIPLPHVSKSHPLGSRMEEFLNYIAHHYSEDIRLEELAASANVSKSECLRCFKVSLQTTPYQYLLEYRLSKAAEFLRETDFPIGEVSEAVGFNQVSHFGRCFKEKTGCTPREYRIKHRSISV